MNAIAAYLFYAVAFKAIGIHEMRLLRRLGHYTGFLDGDEHDRDGIPDTAVGKVINSVMSTSSFRPMFTIILAYKPSLPPSTINWYWLFIETGMYSIILDFYYYWYHRALHEVDALWKYHRTHHLTKHPNPMLTLYADFEQEVFDIAGIPLITYFTMRFIGFPLGFYEWWIAHMYVMFTELAGHCGLRAAACAPNTLSWALDWVGGKIIIEDHDMHHRRGWKKSCNYGKQTMLWDTIFGTRGPRIETNQGNIDYSSKVDFPMW